MTEAVTDNQNAPEDELGSLEAQVTTFIDKNMGISLMDADVSTCHTLPGKKDTPNIVIRLANRKVKNKILRQAKQLKGTNVYINEHLTAKNTWTGQYLDQKLPNIHQAPEWKWTTYCKA